MFGQPWVKALASLLVLLITQVILQVALDILHYIAVFLVVISWQRETPVEKTSQSNINPVIIDKKPISNSIKNPEPNTSTSTSTPIEQKKGELSKFFSENESDSENHDNQLLRDLRKKYSKEIHDDGEPIATASHEKEIEILQQKLAESSSNWKMLLDLPHLKIERNTQAKFCFRFQAVLHNSASFCFRVMTNNKNWATRGIQIGPLKLPKREAVEVEVLDDQTKIVYLFGPGFMMMPSRDILIKVHRNKLPDGRLIAIGQSIDHHTLPPKNKVRRANVDISGAIFQPLPDDEYKCLVTCVADADPNGWVPDYLISLVTTTLAPQILAMVNKLIGFRKRNKKLTATTQNGAKEMRTIENKNGEEVLANQQGMIQTRENNDDDFNNSKENRVSLIGHILRLLPSFSQIRRWLSWASPWMITAIYFFVIFRILRKYVKKR